MDALALDPVLNVIAASYNSDLATDFGREVRNLLQDDSYKRLFPDTVLAGDSSAANRWHTKAGRGAYVAAGIGTAVTGRGAHILLIDDPVKDRESAESETYQKRVWDWYRSTAFTRLEKRNNGPQGAIVVVQTRWNDNDLSGLYWTKSPTSGRLLTALL